MIDLNKLITTLAIKFAHRSSEKHYIEDKPKFGLPNYTVASAYKQEQIERIITRPNTLISNEDHLIIDNEFRKYYFVQRIPDYLNPNTFAEMLSLEDVDVEIAYKLFPRTAYDKAIEIKENLKILGAQLMEATSENYHTKSIQKLMGIQEDALAKLEAGNENPFKERIFIIVKADSKKKLDFSSDYLEKFLKGKNIIIQSLDKIQIESYMETLPIGSDNRIIPGREILSEQIEQRYMLVKPQVIVDKDSMIWGYDQNNLPFFFNQWQECPAPHWMLTGMTGQGKSVFAKNIFTNQCLLMIDEKGNFNGGYIIIDPNQEYEDVIKLTNGVYVKLTPDSNVKINILDCLNLTRGEKTSQLEYVFPLLFGAEKADSWTENMWTVIRKALDKCYDAKGIPYDYHFEIHGKKDMPTLNDLYFQIKEDQGVMKPGSTLRQAFDSVINKLSKYVNVDGEHGQFAFMSEPTRNVDFLSLDRLGFSVQNVERSIKSAYNWLMLDTLWKQMEKNRKKILDKNQLTMFQFIIDELHLFAGYKNVMEMLNQITAVARKYNVSMGFITQRISTYKEGSGDGEGSSILANTHTKIFLAQDDIEAKVVGRMYNLDSETIDRLQTLGLGQYFIMIRTKKSKISRFLTNRVFAKGLELFETNPAKILMNRKRQEKEKQKISQKFIENGKEGLKLHFNNSRAYEIYLKLGAIQNKSEKELKQYLEYDIKYKEFGLKALSPSELVSYEFYKYRDQLDKEVEQDIKPVQKEVTAVDITQNPQMYYIIDQLGETAIEKLEKLGYMHFLYRLSQNSSIHYLTKIESHKHMTEITKEDAKNYSSSKNAALLKPEVKYAIDHHLMQVHAHSILAQYIEHDKIKMYESVEADIEFPGFDGNIYAIEAETGSQLHSLDRLQTKVEHNDKKYSNRWVIYVPKAELIPKYSEAWTKCSNISPEEARSRIFYRTTIKEYLENVLVRGVHNDSKEEN